MKSSKLLLFFAIAIAIFGLLYFTGQLRYLVEGGMAVISLSKGDFLSNDPDVNGEAWLVTASLNQQGQYLVASSSPVKFQDIADSKSAIDYFTIKVEAAPQQCVYTIDNKGLNDKVRTLNPEKLDCCESFWDIICDCSDEIAECKSKLNYGGFAEDAVFGRIGRHQIWCFLWNHLATHGTLRTPSTLWSAKITATTSGGRTESGIVTNWRSQSGWLNGNNVYYSWVGDLVGPEQCPVLNVPDVVFYNGIWRTVNPANWNYYKNQALDTFNICVLNEKTSGTFNYQRCIDNYNMAAYAVLNPYPFEFYNLDRTILYYRTDVGNRDINNGVVTLYANKMLRFPVMTFKIRANWVGVVTTIGRPQIVSLTSSEFTTGSQGLLTAVVKNAGDYPGSFSAYATCTAGFTQTGKSPDYLTLSAGQTATQYIYISGSCSADNIGSCTVTVEDRNNPNNRATATTSIKCKTTCECNIANQLQCQGYNIVRCDGCRWKIEETCTHNCYLDNGVPKCGSSTKECKSDAECDDGLDYTVDKCECGLFGLGTCRCTNKAYCKLEYEKCGGILAWIKGDACCPGLSCKNGVCVKLAKPEIDLTMIAGIIGLVVVIVVVVWLLTERKGGKR